MVARAAQAQKLLLCHIEFLLYQFPERLPLRLVVHPRRGAALADHVKVAQDILDRNAVARHQKPRQSCRVADRLSGKHILPRRIAAAELDADGVCVPAVRMLLHIDASRSDTPRRIAVVHRLQPPQIVHKIVCGRLDDIVSEIAKIAACRVVSACRIMQHQIANGLQPPRRVIPGVCARHLSFAAPTAAASTIPSDMI